MHETVVCSTARSIADAGSRATGNGAASKNSHTESISMCASFKLKVLFAILIAILFCPRLALAAHNLVIDPAPVTWNIIGLDSNNVNVGPQDYPAGVRVYNTGTEDATDVLAHFDFTSASPYINLIDNDTVTTTVIPAGGYADFYFMVRVTRDPAAYGATRNYTITITGADILTPLVAADTLYVERLVSQQSNDVLSLIGPPTIQEGEVRTFILTSDTQTNRDQLETFVNFPNDIFQILSITNSFSTPGATSDRFYLDACGWDRTQLPPDNTSCDGPDMYGGRVGGSVVTVFEVLILKTPIAPIHLLGTILDVAGGSFHYNADYGDDILPVFPPADLYIVKSADHDHVEPGETIEYFITVVNPSPNVIARDVVVQDTLPPGLTFTGAVPMPTTGPNPQTWVLQDIPASSTLTIQVFAVGNCDNLGFKTNTATVSSTTSDPNLGNNTTSHTVHVDDETPPLMPCPLPITLASDPGSCSRANVPITPPAATDNCTTVTVTGTRSDGQSLSSPYPVGVTTITWVATDASGRETVCQQTVTIEDTTPPVITCPANITLNADPDMCAKNNVAYAVTATDNCSSVTVILTPPSGSNFSVGTTTVNATAIDSAGNPASCSFTVTVVDTQAPMITCPPAINLNAGPDGCSVPNVQITQPTVSDNCGTPVVSGTRSDALALTEPFPVGTTVITWKATDAAGLMATCQQLVNIADVTPPSITCPPTVNVTASSQDCLAANVVIGTPITSDNCSTQSLVGVRSDGQLLSAPYPLGTTSITWTVIDASGNPASCTQLVNVTDVTPPVITCPATITVSNSPGLCGANVEFSVTATDACGNTSVTVMSSPASGSFFLVGTTLVTSTAVDGSGNPATCTFNVVVQDTEAPTIVCPPDIATCTQDVVIGLPLTADNCGTQTVTRVRSDNLALDAPYPVGTTLVTHTVTDTSGNPASCIQTVVVSDSVLPQVICPADLLVEALPGQCVSGPVEYPEPTVLDDCTTQPIGLIITYNPPEGSTFPVGETTVTITVVDPQQNMASCEFVVRVIDVTPPPLVCPADIVVSNTTGQCGASQVNFTIPPVTDACSNPVTVVADPPSGTMFAVGVTTVTVTATDTAGNRSLCSFTVTVNDTQPPTITCPPAIDVLSDPGVCQAANVDIGVPSTDDNCATSTVTGTRSDGLALSEPFPVGTTIVTWTVADTSGNSASCSQAVTVRDTTNPTIICPPDIIVRALEGQCQSGPVEYELPIIDDNCSTSPASLTVTFDPPQGSTFPVGVSTVTVTVTDLAGNQATCTFTVTVEDVSVPIITCPANISVNNVQGMCGAAVTFEVTAVDPCQLPVTVVTTPASGTVFPVGTTTVVATATDTAGNTANCTFTVTVNDVQPPSLVCPENMVVATSPGECQNIAVFYSAEATDNCLGPVTVTFDPPSGEHMHVGVNPVVVTATDAAGNMATCTFTVTVEDRDPPRLACGFDITTATVPCENDAVVPIVPPEAVDPCGDVTVTGVRSDGLSLDARYPVGVTTITWTATDVNQNQSVCTQLVTVELSDCIEPCEAADLIIMTKMPPVYHCRGKGPKCKVFGWYIITNIGTQPSGQTLACFYVSDDPVLDPSDIPFKSHKKKHRIKPLRPGEMTAIDLKGKAPKGVNMEGKYIIAVVDCINVVPECREDNNTTAEIPIPDPKKNK